MSVNLERIELQKLSGVATQAELGNYVLPWALAPCRLKILFVVDGPVSFNQAYFGLSLVLDTLRNNPEFYVKFDVDKAHRQTDTQKPDPITEPELCALYCPDYENFRFDMSGFDLDKYDQVWFFGFNTGTFGALSTNELEILSRWMDNGGGVFATGDHATLGEALCSQIPRARSMRKWTSAQGVPPGSGPNRHDTNRPGHDPVITFDDESDDIPQRIRVKWYPYPSVYPSFFRLPHPLLCGRDGVINILPDHPHEGEVIDEANIDLTATFTFGTYSANEYPTVGGVQASPEVIAWNTVIGGPWDPMGIKGDANPKEFPSIGAYDGHRANVGRVSVDSTWHHWFDVNLIGRPGLPPTDPKSQGFLYSTAGQKALSRIQNYFRNTAIWLASKAKQRCMCMRALWGVAVRYPILEKIPLTSSVYEVGVMMKKVLPRYISRCKSFYWVLRPYITANEALFQTLSSDGTVPVQYGPSLELAETYLIGGITKEFMNYFDAKLKEGETATDVDVAGALAKGFNEGASVFATESSTGANEGATRKSNMDSFLNLTVDSRTYQTSESQGS